MKLALTYPERFGAAASFSGSVNFADPTDRTLESLQRMDRIFGDHTKVMGTDADLFYLLEKNAKAKHKPRLYVSCGDKDFLYPAHLKFIPALQKHGWDVTRFDKPDTTHSWVFWDEEIAKFIPWMLGK